MMYDKFWFFLHKTYTYWKYLKRALSIYWFLVDTAMIMRIYELISIIDDDCHVVVSNNYWISSRHIFFFYISIQNLSDFFYQHTWFNLALASMVHCVNEENRCLKDLRKVDGNCVHKKGARKNIRSHHFKLNICIGKLVSLLYDRISHFPSENITMHTTSINILFDPSHAIW